MNVTGRAPLGPKQPKAKPRPDYLAAVRGLPCCICEAFGEYQTSPTAAHHPIHGRYGTRKAPDVTAIPLCESHHQGNFDVSKVALHRMPTGWKRLYGPDTDYIAPTQDKLQHLLKDATE